MNVMSEHRESKYAKNVAFESMRLTGSDERSDLRECLRADPSDTAKLLDGGKRPVFIAIQHDAFCERLADAGKEDQFVLRGGVDVDAAGSKVRVAGRRPRCASLG